MTRCQQHTFFSSFFTHFDISSCVLDFGTGAPSPSVPELPARRCWKKRVLICLNLGQTAIFLDFIIQLTDSVQLLSARSSSALSNGAKQFNERTEKRADQRKYILLLLGLRNDNPCILFLLKYGWLYKLRLVYITNFCEDRTFSLHMIKASFVVHSVWSYKDQCKKTNGLVLKIWGNLPRFWSLISDDRDSCWSLFFWSK